MRPLRGDEQPAGKIADGPPGAVLADAGGDRRLSRERPMLEVANVSVAYGSTVRPDGVDLVVGQGRDRGHPRRQRRRQEHAPEGDRRRRPDPAGASAISLGGRDLSALPPHEIVEAGIALVPEGRGIFGELTVAENLMLGAHPQRARADENDEPRRRTRPVPAAAGAAAARRPAP